MKQQVFKLLILFLLCLLTVSCTSKESGQSPEQTDSNYSEPTKIDIDLSALSSTMVYAEVYNIMTEPDSYEGKIIKGTGEYNSFYYEELNRHFHYFIITDATGCCPQGLDFIWIGDHIYPDDYPEIGTTIEVTGQFVKGEIDGQDYYYIAADNLTIIM